MGSILESTQKLDPFAAKFENRRQILPIFAEDCQKGQNARELAILLGLRRGSELGQKLTHFCPFYATFCKFSIFALKIRTPAKPVK